MTNTGINGPTLSHQHKLAISEGCEDESEFLDAIRKGRPSSFTLCGLAKAIGISQASLSAHRKPLGHPNSRPIRMRRARRIEALTGWPADADHWPCGFSVRP